MATIIHGIAASENIDSSGERLSIKGMDISSLDVDGVFNWEHKSDQPDQVVGKVLMAKKIYSEEDCSNEEERHFWKTIETPFIYVKGELFDDYQDSAKQAAAMFKYDSNNSNDRNVMNFSIEGHKIEKKGMDVTRSIARKVTLTVTPCNKAAIAEMYVPKKTKKDELSNIFKSETMVEITLFPAKKAEPVLNKAEIHAEVLGIAPMNKFEPKEKAEKEDIKKDEQGQPGKTDAPKAPAAPMAPKAPVSQGRKIGTTSTGRDIHSHKQIHEYGMMTAGEHREAANMHDAIARKSPDMGSGTHHKNKAMLHIGAAQTAARREAKLNKHASESILKAMDAGSGMSAPGNLSQGAALAKEDLKGKKKKRALIKAKELYKSWENREEFEKFMSARLPNLTKAEIIAIGQAMTFKKEQELAKADPLNSIAGDRAKRKETYKARGDNKSAEIAHEGMKDSHKERLQGIKDASKPNLPKSEKDGDLKKADAFEEHQKARKALPAHHQGKGPDIKGMHDTEVEHVVPPYEKDGTDTVYLKSGHQSHGHPKGKFKVGDKVSLKQHIMGTHILEHKK